MTATAVELSAMRRALELASTPGTPLGSNPRVGCVLLDVGGRVIAEGRHRGAGTPHAEVDALTRAATRGRGATAVVSLEPCDHRGRTGPCSSALIDSGIARVVFAQTDPNPLAAGGAKTLVGAGIEVVGGVLAEEAGRLNRAWSFALEHGRPFVTWKLATTLDGRSAAADGTSQWITSAAARRDVHRLRSLCDVILVGTGTVLADDPELTVRDELGAPREVQPLRAVMGRSELSPGLRVFSDVAESVVLPTHDPGEALDTLYGLDRRHVFLEGGPTLAAAFLRAGLVDEVVAYVAPALLGAGASAVADLDIPTIQDMLRFDLLEVATIGTGDDICVQMTMAPRTTALQGV